MRGKVIMSLNPVGLIGITPAYAGKSHCDRQYLRGVEDHPRLCGEKFRRRSRAKSFLGSPPPMRGKAADRPRAAKAAGITPAYAGKSK